jgi:hypothetical protein
MIIVQLKFLQVYKKIKQYKYLLFVICYFSKKGQKPTFLLFLA